MKGETAQSVANGHNNVTDLEVYLVKDDEHESPWRDSPDWSSQTFQELKEFVANYAPLEEMKIPEVNILLIGQVGAGKSSFLNTINSIFKGEMSSRACTGGADNSLTKRFEKFRIPDPSTKKYLRFRICDTRGLEEDVSIKIEDVGSILDGNTPNHYKFEVGSPVLAKKPGYVKEPTVRDRIHVVVFALDGSILDVLPEGVVSKLKDIKSLVVDRDREKIVCFKKSRTPFRHFDNMNGFLVHKHKNKISEWIGGNSRFELLYKLSRDGGSTKMFHELCDNIGPTVTIFYNTDNNVYGGYLSDSWGRSGGWCTDQRAFLFTLYSAGHWKPMKFPHIDGETHFQTLYRGPCFYSLNSFHTCVKMEKKILSNFYKCITTGLFDGQRFDMKGETAQSVANDHNNVTDMEVYLVKDGLPDEELQIPWRDSTEWNNKGFQELKEFIATYEPFAEMKIPEVNILLIGQAGAGKSSLFNTFNSIFKGGISSRACSGSAEKGITQKFDKLRIRDPSTKKYLRFRICDTCGVKDRINIKNDDIGFIMDGNLPNHYTFDHETGASIKSSGFVKEPTMRDKIHVVVFILDGSNLNFLSNDVVKKLQEIKSLAIDRGVPPLVFLTKIDEICELVRDDVSKVYNSKIVEDAVNKAADLFAIPRFHVLPVKNYEKESELLTSINILALTALRKSLMFADDFLENQYELKQEKMETLNKQD